MGSYTTETNGQSNRRGSVGLGNFSPRQGKIDEANKLQQEAENLYSNARKINPPSGEINEAREYIETINGLLDALASARSKMEQLVNGQYPQSTKNEAQQVARSIDALSSELSSEKQRAQDYINNNDDPREIAPPVDLPGPTQPILRRR